MEISLKEARETEYWLIVLVKSESIPLEKVKSLQEEIDIIIRIRVSITACTGEPLCHECN